MKLNRSRAQFLISAFLWFIILQSTMLWQMNSAPSFICNGSAPWPLSSHAPLLGNGFLTLVLTLGLAGFVWRSFQKEVTKNLSPLPFLFALIVASGLSHALERLSSGCVVDYLHLSFLPKNLFFNLGDLSLTVAILWIAGFSLHQRKDRA